MQSNVSKCKADHLRVLRTRGDRRRRGRRLERACQFTRRILGRRTPGIDAGEDQERKTSTVVDPAAVNSARQSAKAMSRAFHSAAEAGPAGACVGSPASRVRRG